MVTPVFKMKSKEAAQEERVVGLAAAGQASNSLSCHNFQFRGQLSLVEKDIISIVDNEQLKYFV